MAGRHWGARVWLLGFIMFVLGGGLSLALQVVTPWPWNLVVALGVAGLFLAMGGRSLLWVLRYRLNQRKGERDH